MSGITIDGNPSIGPQARLFCSRNAIPFIPVVVPLSLP